jgi:hypothetical protein
MRWMVRAGGMSRRVAVAALAIVVVAGCGGDDAIPLSELPSRLARAQCGRVFRCCALAQIQALYGSGVTDEEICVAQLKLIGDLLIQSVMAQEREGRIHYNGATAATCFQKLGTAACTTASNEMSVVPECGAIFEPQVAMGGPCAGDSECQSGFCERSLTSTAEGTCAQIPTAGMACATRCAPGSYCGNQLTCAAPKADGSFCITDEECVSATCDNPDITGGTCVPAPAATCGRSP